MKIFKYTQLDDGTYSVKIYGRHGTVSSAVSVPESYCGVPVTEVTFGSTLDANFQSLHIPAPVERIVFDNAVNELKLFAGEITVNENNINYCSDGKALYSKDGKTLYRLFPRYLEEYIVMPGTEILAEEAFANHSNLKRVALPDGLREIKKFCFSRCSDITELNIPDSVEAIGRDLFVYTYSLRTLNLPEKLKELGDESLDMLTLPELYIPTSVEHISEWMITNPRTFIGKYIVSDKNRFFRSENGIIYSKDMTVLVKAPSSVPPVFQVRRGVVRIAKGAFSYCKELTEVILPDGLEHINEFAFIGCDLLDVTIPKSVINIGKNALYPLRNLTIYDTLKADPTFISTSNVQVPLEKMLIIRDAETDEIKDRIWAFIPFGNNDLLEIYYGCFDEKWKFDYNCFDDAFDRIGNSFTKACYAAYRLKNPPEPTPWAKAVFTDFLEKSGVETEIMTEYIDVGNLEKFILFAEYMLTEQNITYIADYAAKKNAVEFTAFLLDYRDKHFGELPDGFELR